MTLKEAIESAVRGYLYRVMSESGGNISKACKIAGVSRQTWYRYLHRAGIAGAENAYGKSGRWGRPTLRIGEPPPSRSDRAAAE